MLKKLNIKIGGIHCAGCKTLIEEEVKNLKGVEKIEVNYPENSCQVEYDDNKINENEIFTTIEKLNYKVNKNLKLLGKNKNKKLPIIFFSIFIILIIIGYVLINYFGGFSLMENLNNKNVGYGLIFIIGIFAGFHCIGMCGGLVVAYSTKNIQNEEARKRKLLPHLEYNAGRLISYFLIGGILGGVGSFFGINPIFTGSILIIASILMLLMGLSFIKSYPLLEKIKLNTPQFIARFLFRNKNNKKPKGPFIIGILNGFMPCGPLQAMELYALTSGNVTIGALSMGAYALGTIPIMLIFGFFISNIASEYANKIIKFSGILIIILAIIMLNRGLTSFGYNFLSFNSNPTKNSEEKENNYQVIKMDLTYYGYVPNVLYIKKGVPVKWIINVKQMSGCTNAIMIESLNIKRDLKYGENIIEFTPPIDAKEIKFSCWMRMVWGKFVINDERANSLNAKGK